MRQRLGVLPEAEQHLAENAQRLREAHGVPRATAQLDGAPVMPQRVVNPSVL
jgi:hypothetical protein